MFVHVNMPLHFMNNLHNFVNFISFATSVCILLVSFIILIFSIDSTTESTVSETNGNVALFLPLHTSKQGYVTGLGVMCVCVCVRVCIKKVKQGSEIPQIIVMNK